MRTPYVAIGALAAILLTCDTVAQRPSRPATRLELTCGVYTSDKATTMYRMFTPVLEVLQAGLETDLHRPVDIELKIFKTYEDALEAFVSGEVDFVRFGPASYVLAKHANPAIELLVVESNKGERTFQGMIVVRSDSPIRTLADLRGKRFAFGDENSTIGRYLAQDQLVAAGITAHDLQHDRAKDYLDRHDKVFSAVEVGEYDAGSLKDSTFKKMNVKGQLRVLATFENVTKPWIARKGLDPTVKSAIRTTLLGLDDAEALAALRVDGFLTATDQQFEVTRQAMKRSLAFYPPPAEPGK